MTRWNFEVKPNELAKKKLIPTKTHIRKMESLKST